MKDFSPVTLAVTSPNILVVHPSLPAKSVRELIALIRARPGVLNYATSGTGGSGHLAAELFKSMVESLGSTPEELAACVKSEMDRLGKVIAAAGIRNE